MDKCGGREVEEVASEGKMGDPVEGQMKGIDRESQTRRGKSGDKALRHETEEEGKRS